MEQSATNLTLALKCKASRDSADRKRRLWVSRSPLGRWVVGLLYWWARI
jgi:hypothetical protein